ncbi:hypothetical protein EXD81_12625 [Bacillus amyloliquefaciens]|nr:hypothetical protein EXD81_12625 [Bacillus amyloliquefaciens]
MATTNKKLFGRVVKITIDNGSSQTTFDYKDLEIHFEVPFDDDFKPNETKVEIYNLSKDSINKIKKGSTITVQAGYRDDYGVLTIGKVTKVLNNWSGLDKVTSIYSKDGDDYTHMKVTTANADPAEKYYVKKRYKLAKPVVTVRKDKNGRTYKTVRNYGTREEVRYRKRYMKITFKAGTTSRQIIDKLLRVLGIKVKNIILPKNKVYKKGYRVTGLIENNLEEVIHDAGAVMYYRRGKPVIRPLNQGDDERFKLEEATGLIETPEQVEEDNFKGYKAKCLLQHRIAVASIIEINSKTAKGKYRVKEGTHSFDGRDFFTECKVM